MYTSIEPVDNYFKADCNDLEVGMFEWTRTDKYTTLLGTGGLASCLGVAAYNEASKVAHLAHFVSVEATDAGATAFFDSVANTLGSSGDTTVWLRGGNAALCGDMCENRCIKIPSKTQCQSVLESRDLIVSSLRQCGVLESQMDTKWNEIQDIWVGMSINSITGEYRTKDIWAPTRRAIPFKLHTDNVLTPAPSTLSFSQRTKSRLIHFLRG